MKKFYSEREDTRNNEKKIYIFKISCAFGRKIKYKRILNSITFIYWKTCRQRTALSEFVRTSLGFAGIKNILFKYPALLSSIYMGIVMRKNWPFGDVDISKPRWEPWYWNPMNHGGSAIHVCKSMYVYTTSVVQGIQFFDTISKYKIYSKVSVWVSE